MEELEDLQSRHDAIQATVEKVLTFPSKVSYDGLVPISKIAFCPGKVIHTNEFKVLGEGQSEADLSKIEFTSYTETADILKLRLAELNDQIKALTRNDSKSAYVPPTVPLSQSMEVDSDRVYEIREFYDGDGNIMMMDTDSSQPKHELVDISEELNKLEKLSQSPLDYKGSSLVQTDDDEFIRELSLMASQNRSERSRMEMESMDDFFAVLEAKQQPQSKTSTATNNSSRSSNSGWKAGFLSSGSSGEAKSSSTQKRKQAVANNSSAITSATAASLSFHPPSEPAATATEPKKRVKIVENQNTTQVIDNREMISNNMAALRLEERQEQQRITAEARAKETVEEKETRTAQRAKAFSGKIIEKFP